eukprot:321647-Chlamydomonas_euryale.AAC.1
MAAHALPAAGVAALTPALADAGRAWRRGQLEGGGAAALRRITAAATALGVPHVDDFGAAGAARQEATGPRGNGNGSDGGDGNGGGSSSAEAACDREAEDEDDEGWDLLRRLASAATAEASGCAALLRLPRRPSGGSGGSAAAASGGAAGSWSGMMGEGGRTGTGDGPHIRAAANTSAPRQRVHVDGAHGTGMSVDAGTGEEYLVLLDVAAGGDVAANDASRPLGACALRGAVLAAAMDALGAQRHGASAAAGATLRRRRHVRAR